MPETHPFRSDDYLSQQYLSGDITPDESEILWNRLQESPELSRALFHQLETDAMLQDVFQNERPLSNAAVPNKRLEKSPHTVEKPSRRRRLTTAFLLGALSVCVLFVLSSPFWLVRNEGPSTVVKHDPIRKNGLGEEFPEATSDAVAYLSGNVDAVWNDPSFVPVAEQPISPGKFRLRSGLVSFRFFNGAELVLEGPAEWEIVSVSRVDCDFGRLNVTVPPQAHGFQVFAPKMSVKDLGTAFAMAVSPRGTEVHVLQGEVELHDIPTGQENLKEGQAAFVPEQGDIHRFQANNDSFAPFRSLKDKTKEYLQLRYKKWKDGRRRLHYDPALLVHLDFEEVDWTHGSVPNTVSTKPDENAVAVGCRSVEGRWPGKGGIEFSRVSDRIRFRVAGAYESFTLAAWVRVNSLDKNSNSLFQSLGPDGETIQWRILRSGRIRLELTNPTVDEKLSFDSETFFTSDRLGRWTLLAVVVDGLTQSVTHFADGMILGDPSIDSPFKQMLPISPETAEFGNTPAPSRKTSKPSPIRNLCGCVDEFFLFGRPLSREEIWDIYDPVVDWSPESEGR